MKFIGDLLSEQEQHRTPKTDLSKKRSSHTKLTNELIDLYEKVKKNLIGHRFPEKSYSVS